MEAAQETAGCPRGRPRDPQTDARILACAIDQLAEDGYAGMTIDAVARAAGVSKATIYRRFADKNDLVTAALAGLPSAQPDDFTGGTRERLVQLLESVRTRTLRGPGITIHHQILAEAERNPELVRLHRERKIAPRRAIGRQILEDGVRAGEVRGDIDLDYVVDLISGSWMSRWAAGGEFSTDWAENVMATLWPAIAA